MSSVSTNRVLNRLLAILNRSLPMYLADAAPWVGPSGSRLGETLTHIVSDHQGLINRLGEMIFENGGFVEPGHFPLSFTSFNDLSETYLIQELIRRQVAEVVEIEKCVEQLSLAPMAKAIAQEALGAALGHLDSLKELATTPAAV